MKKIAIIVLIIMAIVMLPLVAGAQEEKAASSDGTFTIGWSNAGMGDSWRQFLQSNFLAEVAANPEITKYYITHVL